MLHQAIDPTVADNIPDPQVQNLYHADCDLDALLRLYLDLDLFVHLRQHFERLVVQSRHLVDRVQDESIWL